MIKSLIIEITEMFHIFYFVWHLNWC